MTLINLVGGQLAPNYFAALKLKPDHIILCHTEDTLDKALQLEQQIVREHPCRIEMVSVDPFDFDAIRREAVRLVNNLPEPAGAVLNITGGTKPLSFSFAEAFRGTGAQMLYVDTQNECLWWNESGVYRSEPFDFRFSVSQWLSMQGVADFDQTDINLVHSLRDLTGYIFMGRLHKTGNGKTLQRFQSKLVAQMSRKEAWEGPIRMISYPSGMMSYMKRSG